MSETLLYILGILIVILMLGLSIAIHELGHLLPAKAFGVRVKQYMVGFGPTVFSWRRGETEYGIKAIPLGGYISMIGMFPPEKSAKPYRGLFAASIRDARTQHLGELEPGDEGRQFYKLSPLKKMIVMLGGPIMNFIFGMGLVAAALTGIGSPQPAPTIDEVFACLDPSGPNAECVAGDPVSPASAAGLLEGDTLVAVSGTAVSSWSQALEQLGKNPGTEVSLVVDRNGSSVPILITPIFTERQVFDTATGRPIVDANGLPVTELRPVLGVRLETQLSAVPLSSSLRVGLDATASVVSLVLALPVAVVDVAASTFGLQERNPEGPISILGVGQIAGQVASAENASVASKLATGLMIAGSLNFALFVFNLIPLLPLDGGHVAGAAYESAKRRSFRLLGRQDPGPVDTARMLPVAYLVWVLLILVGSLLIFADILDPILLF